MGLKLAIVGSREYFPLRDVEDYIRTLPLGTTIISGWGGVSKDNAVDRTAETTAKSLGYEVISFPPLYTKYGPGATFIRNKQIVDECDKLVAFWNFRSRGTAHTILLAAKAKKLLEVKISLVQAENIARRIQGGDPLPSYML